MAQAAQLVLARVAADLDGCVPGSLSSAGTTLDLDVLSVAPGDTAPDAQHMTYRFDARTGRLRRDGAAVNVGPFEFVGFAVEEIAGVTALEVEVRVAGVPLRARLSAPQLVRGPLAPCWAPVFPPEAGPV